MKLNEGIELLYIIRGDPWIKESNFKRFIQLLAENNTILHFIVYGRGTDLIYIVFFSPLNL